MLSASVVIAGVTFCSVMFPQTGRTSQLTDTIASSSCASDVKSQAELVVRLEQLRSDCCKTQFTHNKSSPRVHRLADWRSHEDPYFATCALP